jgi:hypothetical protein
LYGRINTLVPGFNTWGSEVFETLHVRKDTQKPGMLFNIGITGKIAYIVFLRSEKG